MVKKNTMGPYKSGPLDLASVNEIGKYDADSRATGHNHRKTQIAMGDKICACRDRHKQRDANLI